MLNFETSVAEIDGWLTKDEGLALYELARNVPTAAHIVEIGSWKGRSTVCLGLGSQDGNRASILAIDPHTGSWEQRWQFGKVDTYNEFLLNVEKAGVFELTTPVRATSEEAARKFRREAHFVLVDGAHDHDFVALDYQLWFPKLINGGHMAFHDSWHAPGVHYLTSRILLTSPRIKNPRLVDTLTIVEKTARNSLLDRLGNAVFVGYRLLVGWIGLIKMIPWRTNRLQ